MEHKQDGNEQQSKQQQQRQEQRAQAQRILDQPPNEFLTTNQGVPVANNQDQLTAGARGPT